MINILDYIYNSNYFKIKEHKKNSILYNEGDICEYIHFVISGKVVIKTYTTLEKEEIISVINSNEWFADVLAFSLSKKYLGIVETTENSKIAYISKNKLLELCSIDINFLEFYLSNICNKSLNIKQQNKLFAHKNIRDRIMYYFDSLKHKMKSNVIYISSINDLANTLSIPRPSVSRELINMENDNLIIKSPKKINNQIKITIL